MGVSEMEMMSDENTEEVMVLEAQIERLHAEVESLKRQQQDNHKDISFHFRGQMEDALAYMCGQRQEGGRERVLFGLKEEVEEMEKDLKQQTQMNGISLNSCTTKTLQSSGSKVVQQLCVSGHCSEVIFQVEFQLSEVKKGERSERTISDLKVVLDSSDLRKFSSFLSRVEEHRELLLFFRTLRTFSDRCDDRCRTFQHFQEKYPSVVSLPGGCRSEVMTLNHPELPGCVLFVHWSVEVSREGAVTPQINLLTKIPEGVGHFNMGVYGTDSLLEPASSALQLFPSQAVGGAAEAFQSLLRILGPEAAVESVIRADDTHAAGGGSGRGNQPIRLQLTCRSFISVDTETSAAPPCCLLRLHFYSYNDQWLVQFAAVHSPTFNSSVSRTIRHPRTPDHVALLLTCDWLINEAAGAEHA